MKKNVLKKAALFTDIHFGAKRDDEQHNVDCINFLNWFSDKVKSDKSIDHIVFLGDYFDHRDRLKASTLNFGYEGAKILNSLNMPVIWCVGNHELGNRNNRDIVNSIPFEQFSNISFVKETTVFPEMGEYGSVVAPFLFEDEYPTLLDYKGIPTLYIHGEFKGFKLTGEHYVKEHGPSHTDYKHFTKILSGHYHARQVKDNVAYIGNPFPTNYADTNDTNRGMATYEYSSNSLKFIDWPDAPQYLKLKLSDVLENPKATLVKNARVKVDVDTEITFEESNIIREKLQKKFALREITLEESYSIDVQLSEDEQAIEELQLETTNEVITELLRRIKDSSVDTELLLSIYKKLSTSAKEVNSKAANVEFIELTMENYLSYGNNTTSVNLNFDTPTLIVGRNYDSVVDGQVDSNGAGKSTILNGLLMCMFDKNLMGVDKNAQINKANKKNMLLTCTFKVDGKYYKVERYRKNKLKGGDGVRLFMNPDEPVFGEEQDVTPDSVTNCNNEIERIIGIPYEMFIRIVVFSATHEPFLSLPSSHASKANQRDIIEELFGLTELTHKAEKLKELLSASKSEFKNLVEINTRLEAEHGRHDQQVAVNIQRLNDWDNSRESRIVELETQISEMQKIDPQVSIEYFKDFEKHTKELTKVERNVPALQAELRNIVSLGEKRKAWDDSKKSSITDLQSQIKTLQAIDFATLRTKRAELEQAQTDKTALKAEFNKWQATRTAARIALSGLRDARTKKESEIAHLGYNQCPYCMQQFAEAKVKIQECQHNLDTIDKDISAKQDEASEIEVALADVESKMLEVDTRIRDLLALNIPSNLDAQEANLGNLQRRLKEVEQSTNPHIGDADALTEDNISEELAEISAKSAAIKSKILMAKEFIHPSFKTMADAQSHQVRVDTLKNRIEEIEHEVNPFISVVDSLLATKLEALKHDEINKLDKEIKHQDFLLKLLTKKDSFIRKALLNKSIPLLNTRLRNNLDKVGLPHRVTFTEEMEVSISQFGADYEYGNFSAGQKARVNLCLAFAFRDVLQSRFGKINLCILDECLDTGLGNVGVTQATKMIKSIAHDNHLSMFVISHRDEVLNMFDKRIEIELRNGFSNILA